MGFEALLLDKEVHCYGLPFYAGWGVTHDKLECHRREKKLTVDEIFAGAYILYTSYYNPYLNEESNILEVIDYIVENRKSDNE
jgi:capsular polysaccharide export protein